jgi:hypothetical protein
MECNKWEETGLLYISKELDETQRIQFKNHLSTCAFCSTELTLYSLEKTRFFSPDILSVPTSPELDIKIMSRCTAVRPTQVGIMGTLWIRRIVFSTLMFAFGAGAGGYFMFAYYHAKSDATIAAAKTKAMASPIVSSTASSTSDSHNNLSLDTSKHEAIAALRDQHAPRDKSGLSPSATTTPGASRGIITVDLKKE